MDNLANFGSEGKSNTSFNSHKKSQQLSHSGYLYGKIIMGWKEINLVDNKAMEGVEEEAEIDFNFECQNKRVIQTWEVFFF